MERRPLRAAVLVVAVVALAGCGSSSARTGTATVAGYGSYGPVTIVVPAGVPRSPACRRDASIYAEDALAFVAHHGAAGAYPADLYYSGMRYPFADFEARHCDVALLGAALQNRLNVAQRRTLVAFLPDAMATVVRAGLAG